MFETVVPRSSGRTGVHSCLAFVLAALCCALTAPRASAQGRPPVAYPTEVEATRGEAVTITLEGITSTSKPLDFAVLEQPKAGKLLDEKPLVKAPAAVGERTVATIRYLPEKGQTATEDFFTFRTSIAGAPPSAAQKVKIRIKDLMARLNVPSAAEFGRATMGESALAEFKISNSGNGPWQAAVPAPEGLKWVQPADGRFTIEPGKSSDVKLSWTPKEPGEMQSVITFGEGLTTRLTGRGMPPFSVGSIRVALVWDAAARARKGRLELQSNRLSPLELNVRGGEMFGLPAILKMEPAQALQLDLLLQGDPAAKIQQTVSFSGSGWEAKADVTADPAPAWLEMTGAGGIIDFGKPEAAVFSEQSRKVTVRNTGGVSARLSVSRLTRFSVEGLPEKPDLAPGEEIVLTVRPLRQFSGMQDEDLKTKLGTLEATVKLRCEVSPEAVDSRPETGAALPGSGTKMVELMQDPLGVGPQGMQMANREGLLAWNGLQSKEIPTVTQAKLIKHAADEIIIEWEVPAPGDYNYIPFTASVMAPKEKSMPVKVWLPADPSKFKITRSGTVARLSITGLPPGVRVPMRILTTNAAGDRGRASKEWNFWTSAKEERRWWLYALFALLIVGVILWLRQRWKADIKWKT